MLYRFIVNNFGPFKEETELSLIPGKSSRMSEHRLDPVKGISALKLGAVFGANASGKSSIVKAIAFGKELVLREQRGEEIDYQPYLLCNNNVNLDSEMRYEIQANGKNYCFGFVFNRRMIVEEWLVEISKRGTDQTIYSLKRDKETGEVTFLFDYLKKKNKKEESQQFITFIAKATPRNQLFIHEAFTRNMAQNIDDFSDIHAVVDWFANTLKIILPDETYKMGFTLKAAGSDDLKGVYSKLLKFFDTGIESIDLERVDFDKLPLPLDFISKIKNDILQQADKVRFGTLTTRGNIYLISAEGDRVNADKLITKHESIETGEIVSFDLKDESDGTIRLLDYIPLIIDLMFGGKVFIVDEMERSLHPNLIHALIELFISLSEGVSSQLILTTHESTLLNQSLLRKDEIWFVVRESGKSELVGLEEYGVRYDKDIRSEYLKGSYKGIPIFGNKDELKTLFDNTHNAV